MTKSTMDTTLPRKLEQKMQIVENRSGWLDCAEISVLLRLPNGPLVHLLQGAPTVAIGIYLRVLYALQLDDDILLLAKEDAMGKALQDLSLKKRGRASKKE